MMPGEIARQWFVPGEGIDRHVISADIQRYLGNDATVRPGDNQGVPGYWIKAYRNLTSAMISDLRQDSQRWRQEQRQTGTREPYVGSRTYEASSASRVAQRREADSPSLDGAYGVSQSRGRTQGDQMQIDPQPVARPDPRYGQPQQPARGYQPENGAYPPAGRDRYPDQGGRPPYQDQPMQDAYTRPQVSGSYGNDPRYVPSYPDTNPGVPQGYYMPVTSGYGQQPIMASSRPDPQYPPQPFGQPQVPTPRDARDQRDHRGEPRDPRDPRYGGQPDYNEPRYAYPSPAATVSSVAAREREPITSPPQPSPFGTAPPQYDQYGRRKYNNSPAYGTGADRSAPAVQPTPQGIYGASDSGYPPQSRGEPSYGRERQPAAPVAAERERDSNRRRRLH